MDGQITDVPSISGHRSDFVGATGCTVVLASNGVVRGVDVRGDSPGTRETPLLGSDSRVQEVPSGWPQRMRW